MKKLSGLIFYAIGTLLIVLFTPLGFLYTALRNICFLKFSDWIKQIQNYFLVLVVALDQYANVMMKDLFDAIVIKQGYKGYSFGNPDDTIGYVVRQNKKRESLTFFGKFIQLIIDHKR